MMIGVLASFAVTIGGLLVALRLVKRVQGPSRGSAIPFEVLKRISCGPRQGIALVRVSERVLVVSLAEGGARLLTELAPDEVGDALAEPVTEPLPLVSRRLMAMVRFPTLCILVALSLTGRPCEAVAQTAQDSQLTFTPLVQGPPQIDITIGDEENGLKISGAVGVVILMTVMTLLPALFLMMTSFTRILIVLHFLRSALATQATPPGQLLVAIALLLTGVVMAPTIEEANQRALQPYLNGDLTQVEAYRAAIGPFREFMLANTSDRDLGAFAEMGGHEDLESVDDVPTITLISAFVVGELKTAFQIGFVIFLPFTVVDLVVASVLMSMGMFMLPPIMISLPFKLLLFVLADGWNLVVQNVVASFSF